MTPIIDVCPLADLPPVEENAPSNFLRDLDLVADEL